MKIAEANAPTEIAQIPLIIKNIMEKSFIVTINTWTTKIHDAIDRSVRTNHPVIDAQCVQAIIDGMESAGAHFQQQLSGVLSGLLYKECELYMDDIRLFADSKEEMLQRLYHPISRFRAYIGMDRVEYVMDLIDSEGIHFTRTKFDTIAKFE
jgi:hypothetical protein